MRCCIIFVFKSLFENDIHFQSHLFNEYLYIRPFNLVYIERGINCLLNISTILLFPCMAQMRNANETDDVTPKLSICASL